MLIFFKKIKETFSNEEAFFIALNFLAFSIKEVNKINPNNWSLIYEKKRIRLHSGGFIIFTLYNGKVWCALDNNLEEEDEKTLESVDWWSWDEGLESNSISSYSLAGKHSRNGYFRPSNGALNVQVIQKYHLRYIQKIGVFKIRKSTKIDHNKELINNIEEILGLPLPNPY